MRVKVPGTISCKQRVIYKALAGLLIFVSTPGLANEETTKFVKDFNLSEGLKPKSKFLGFIDPNYQRLKMVFSSVKKDKADPTKYLVEGRSIVKENVCKFSGFIKFEKLANVRNQFRNDPELANSSLKSQGELLGTYQLKEEDKESCGVFKGSVVFNWFVDGDGKIHYDDLEMSESDNFKNNQYKGTWSAYGSGKSKTANWGEFRIPNSGDLDNGAGEFSPREKYRKYGWYNYGESTDH
jgi:hypothetical protein